MIIYLADDAFIMAKIIYGVLGEGYGHAIRSRVAIDYLRKKHDVHIIGGGKAYSYLSSYFKEITKVEHLKFHYERDSVRSLRSLAVNFRNLIGLSNSFVKVKNLMEALKPDVAISDFEALTFYVANFLKIPVISADNVHFITNCRFGYPSKFYSDYLKAKLVIKITAPKTAFSIIMSYVDAKTLNRHSFLVPPLIRKNIQNLNPKREDFVLVYQTSDANKHMLALLPKINENFVVYGFNKELTYKNIILKKFNEEEFLDELVNCKALIANGGFSTISEALYLGKPVLSIPIKKTFEQIINAVNLEKTGCGKFIEEATIEEISEFLKNLGHYRKNASLSNFRKQWSNKYTFDKLENLIKREYC